MIVIPSAGDIRRVNEGGDEDIVPIDLKPAHDRYAAIVGRTLVKHYPGCQWRVTIRLSRGGLTAYIQVPKITGRMGMVVHLGHKPEIHEIEHEVMKAGGELLERFNVRRVRGTEADIENLPKNLQGEVIGAEKGEVSNTKAKLRAGVRLALRDIDARDLKG